MIEFVIQDRNGEYHYTKIIKNEKGLLSFEKDIDISNQDIDLISKQYMICENNKSKIENVYNASSIVSLIEYMGFLSFLIIIGGLMKI